MIPVLIPILKHYGMVDVPSDRRIHGRITPRGGGIALVTVISMLCYFFEHEVFEEPIGLDKILPFFLLISLVSFIDDIKHLSVTSRLYVHFICASCAIYFFLYQYPASPLPSVGSDYEFVLKFLIYVLFSVGFLNIYNFMDGIDGLTAVETLHISGSLFLLCTLCHDIIKHVQVVSVISAVIAGAALGFLVFNKHPARIFIGDVGSIGIGFILSICLILVGSSDFNLVPAVLIVSLYYIADGTLTILIRLINGEKIWEPHLKHFFQYAVRNGMSNSAIINRVILCNLCLTLLSVGALYYPKISLVCAIIVVGMVLISFRFKV
jgi:UDP-N-acetylmuramyl pentapeptide phosphotransferase/UDP-N-acetylglucosamine-1-phosphate transferase